LAGWRSHRGLGWLLLAIAGVAAFGVVVDPAPMPPPVHAVGRAAPSSGAPILAVPTPRPERRIQSTERLAGSDRRVVSSVLVRGVRLQLIRLPAPTERIEVITVAPWALLR